MSTKIEVVADGQYRITKTDDKTGKVQDSVIEHADKALEGAQLGSVLTQTVKAAGTRRAAFCSFLGQIYSSPRLDGFRGTGDRKTGKLTPEFKAAVRSVEEDVVKELVGEGSIKLPRGVNPEESMQAFLSGLRDDKNYSNAKNTTNKYFALLGAKCVTASGFVVPVPVMQAELAELIERAAPDTSVASKLRAIEEFMGKGTIDSEDAVNSLALAKTLVGTLEGIVKYYAELATNQRHTKPVDQQAQDALNKARSEMPEEHASA